MTDPLVAMVAMEKLKQEIKSHIDMRHQEWRDFQMALFEKMRADLNSDRRGRTKPNPSSSISFDEPAPGTCPKSCLTLSEIMPDGSLKQKKYSETHHLENGGGVGIELQESPRTESAIRLCATSRPDNAPPKAEAHGVGRGSVASVLERGRTTSEHDAGQPKGQFFGRQNLFAFLQAKNWDSEFAQEPDKETVVEKQAITNPWTRFKIFIDSTVFDGVVGTFIVANAITMSIQLEYEGTVSAETIGVQIDEGEWTNAEEAFGALETFFVVLFLVELIVRLAAMGLRYFKSVFGWLDFIIVTASVLESFILPFFGAEFPKIMFLRLLRVFKLVRVLRVVRLLSLFENLRVLVMTVSHSLWSLLWAFLLLGVVQTIGGIFMTQSLQGFLMDESQPLEDRRQVYVFFGSFSRSCITLFEMTLAIGTWGRCGRIVIFGVNRFYAIFFLGYLYLVAFGMIRVIGALFLKDTLASTAKEGESTMAEMYKNPQYIHKIWQIFNRLDQNHDGEVSFVELNTELNDPEVVSTLQKMGIAVHELKGLLALMDDGDGEISFCEFLTGIMRLKNANKGVDLATLLYENKKILKRVLRIGKRVDFIKDELVKNNAGYSKTWSSLSDGGDHELE